jgi:anti-sigma-K factor RskA
MSDADTHNALPEDELLAAEYALGVLSGPDRAAAELRLGRDHSFATLVAEWEQRLAPWAAEIADVTPPAQVWKRIAAQLPTQSRLNATLWQNLAFWRWCALAGGVLAAACLGILVYFGTLPSQAPLIAALNGGGRHVFVATIDPQRATVVVMPADFSVAAGRVPELWLITPGAKPRPLGLIDPKLTIALTLPANLRAQANTRAVLAVSLEPPGGSPTGQPTGPVIASGKLTKL